MSALRGAVVVIVVAGRSPVPVVVGRVVVVVVDGFGSLTNFSLSSGTAILRSPIPRNPPTLITIPDTLPDASSRTSAAKMALREPEAALPRSPTVFVRAWAPYDDCCGGIAHLGLRAWVLLLATRQSVSNVFNQMKRQTTKAKRIKTNAAATTKMVPDFWTYGRGDPFVRDEFSVAALIDDARFDRRS